MRRRCRGSLAALFLALSALTLGCARGIVTTPPDGPANVAPISERDRERQRAWAEATEGLDFHGPDASIEVQPILPGDPALALRRLELGRSALAENRLMEALGAFTLSARHDPRQPEAYVGLGAILVAEGRLDWSLAAYRTAIERAPDHVEARFGLAQTLWTANRQDEAVATMRALATLAPDHGGAQERLAVWSYYREDYAAAWDHLHAARRLGVQVPGQLPSLLARHLADPGKPDDPR